MMKVLVTGSAGFLGRRFTAELTRRGHEVRGLDLLAPRRHDRGDVRDDLPERYFDLVVHCAGVVGGRANIEDSPLGCAANLAIDATLFGWARRNRPGRVLYLSSSAVYPVDFQFGERRLLNEYDVSLGEPRLPDELYGWAKLTGEHLAHRAQRDGLAVTVVRPFSGYGEDQALCYPFAAFGSRAWHKADPFDVWGNGEQVRDFIHADDVVAGALAVAESGFDRPVNLGTGWGTSMADLARMFCDAAGYSPAVRYNPERPAGVRYRVADPTAMLRFYKPRITLEEGIARYLRTKGMHSGIVTTEASTHA